MQRAQQGAARALFPTLCTILCTIFGKANSRDFPPKKILTISFWGEDTIVVNIFLPQPISKFLSTFLRNEIYGLNGVMTSGWCIHPGGPQGYYLDCSVFLLASTWIQAAAQFPTRYTDA